MLPLRCPSDGTEFLVELSLITLAIPDGTLITSRISDRSPTT
jgi:hypothetical protein